MKAMAARRTEVLESIEQTGTYEHTRAELEWGTRMAWRNASKCSNRKFWADLQLLDHRAAATPAEMFAVRVVAHAPAALGTTVT
jgi:nitric-oxide synthase, bacterial